MYMYDDLINTSNPNRAVGPTSALRPYYTALHGMLTQARPRFTQLWAQRHGAARAQAEAAVQTNHAARTAAFLAKIRNRATKANWSNIKNADPITLKNATNWNGNHGVGIKMGPNTKYFTVNTFRRLFGENWLNLNGEANLRGRNPLTRGPVKRKNVVIVRFEGNKPSPKRNKSASPKRARAN